MRLISRLRLFNGDGPGRRLAASGGLILGGFLGGLVTTAGAGVCTAFTVGGCLPAGPVVVGAGIAGGAATGSVMATSIYDFFETANDNQDSSHGNSKYNKEPTELYHLINRSTGEIDKIGITNNPAGRYSDTYLDAENVDYIAKHRFSWRLPATVAETIELNFYKLNHGSYPRLNKIDR